MSYNPRTIREGVAASRPPRERGEEDGTPSNIRIGGRRTLDFMGHDENGGAPMHHIQGYHQPAAHDPLDYNKLRQYMEHGPALAEAQRLHRENMMISPKGEIVPKGNFSPHNVRQQAAFTAAATAAKTGGKPAPVGMTSDQIENAFKPGAPAIASPAAMGSQMPLPTGGGMASSFAPDPSTVRQPVGPVGRSDSRGALDAAGNPASDSRPPVGTPAEMRQMARDAANGYSTNTTGQGANLRQTISSRYGSGSSTPAQPGQGPATKFGPNAASASANYFDPKAIRQSVASATPVKKRKPEDTEEEQQPEEENPDEDEMEPNA